MKPIITFGEDKVFIRNIITNDNKGACGLFEYKEKLTDVPSEIDFNALSNEPCILVFNNTKGLDTLIESLKSLRKDMEEADKENSKWNY